MRPRPAAGRARSGPRWQKSCKWGPRCATNPWKCMLFSNRRFPVQKSWKSMMFSESILWKIRMLGQKNVGIHVFLEGSEHRSENVGIHRAFFKSQGRKSYIKRCPNRGNSRSFRIGGLPFRKRGNSWCFGVNFVNNQDFGSENVGIQVYFEGSGE